MKLTVNQKKLINKMKSKNLKLFRVIQLDGTKIDSCFLSMYSFLPLNSNVSVRLMTFRSMYKKGFLDQVSQYATATQKIESYILNNKRIQAYLDAAKKN